MTLLPTSQWKSESCGNSSVPAATSLNLTCILPVLSFLFNGDLLPSVTGDLNPTLSNTLRALSKFSFSVSYFHGVCLLASSHQYLKKNIFVPVKPRQTAPKTYKTKQQNMQTFILYIPFSYHHLSFLPFEIKFFWKNWLYLLSLLLSF